MHAVSVIAERKELSGRMEPVLQLEFHQATRSCASYRRPIETPKKANERGRNSRQDSWEH